MAQSILKTKLKELLESVNYSYTHWVLLLGISKSAISQWFKDDGATKPDSEHILQIKKIIESHNDTDLNGELNALYIQNIFEVDNDYRKYKALNLFDYASKSLIERINDAIIHIDIPSNEKIEYFEHILGYLALSSNVASEDRKLPSEISEHLLNRYRRDERVVINNLLEKVVSWLHSFDEGVKDIVDNVKK